MNIRNGIIYCLRQRNTIFFIRKTDTKGVSEGVHKKNLEVLENVSMKPLGLGWGEEKALWFEFKCIGRSTMSEK